MKNILKIISGVLLFFAIIFAAVYFYIWYNIPNNIILAAGENQTLQFNRCIDAKISDEEAVDTFGSMNTNKEYKKDLQLNLNNQYYSDALDTGDYVVECKLLGLMTVKQVNINVVDRKILTVGGEAVGVYIETNGVLVLGSGTVTDILGNELEPAKGIIQSGDYIVGLNDIKINNKKELLDAISEYGQNIKNITIRRNHENIQYDITPVETEPGIFKLGIWVRDNAVGIGTVTYYDSNNNFGALGHGIDDSDTGTLMETSNGNMYETDIVSIKKGISGEPGELSGVINYNSQYIVGKISKNTDAGIFGKIVNDNGYLTKDNRQMPIAYKQEVKCGEASILCCIEDSVKEYQIEIKKIDTSGTNKGIIIEVTDKELLQKTGGIVQGMSGSPIIQDGKIVGAVTHVFVNEPTKGYGIFAETMLQHN